MKTRFNCSSRRVEDGALVPFYHSVACQCADPQTAGKAAIEADGIAIDYRSLNRQANRLAHFLIRNGICSGDVVAVVADRAVSTVIMLLAIAKAGAAYTPLDPAEPESRRRAIVEDSGCVAILSNGPALSGLPRTIRTLDCLAKANAILRCPVRSPEIAPDLDRIAYVLFTSGSTGRPKGVAMPHRGLANLLAWHRNCRPASGARRTLQFCSLGFDFSFHEIFSTLANGGTLVLAPDSARRDPSKLAQFIHNERIERAFLPVSVLTLWADAVTDATQPHELVEIFTTGEALRITPRLRALCQHHRILLHNHYGGTEFQDATALTLAGDAANWPVKPGIGRPIDNVTVRVLNGRLEPVVDGQEGVLHIGGFGLAQGYTNMPNLNTQRFITNPEDGARLYITGDIGRKLADGSLEILGRADEQIKIRGIRIEPGEIETWLREAPEVGECAVIGRELFGRMRLLAYVTPAGTNQNLDSDGLVRFLQARLPIALVPDVISVLERLPLTASGKLDRNALPVPEQLPRRLFTPAAPPASPDERRIAEIAKSVLGLGAIGVEDNFFDLGADSISLLTLQRRISDAVALTSDMVDLFRHSTVRALANAISSRPSPAVRGVGERRKTESAGHQPHRSQPSENGFLPMAVLGLAGRFPDAESIEEFWQNIAHSRHSKRELARGELEQWDAQLAVDTNYVSSAAPLRDAELFDAAYFDISPREAQLMDPQHRLMLELAVHALEDAGYGDSKRLGPVGVVAGASSSTYMFNYVAPRFGFGTRQPFVEADLAQFQAKLGNDRNYLTSRLAYKLGLTGPSLTVQTACSTSLVAVHLACTMLASGECDLALAGGISLIFPQKAGYLYEEGMIRSPDGLCKPFDEGAAGTFFSNGGGLVVLKRLDRALADGDAVRAVILGSAVNNDGSQKVGFTAPSLDRQIAVIRQAISRANVDPATIEYVEAHGTGTVLGDRIEIAALCEAYRQVIAVDSDHVTRSVGSVKANIGHLDEAAGIAGFIKTVEALRHAVKPGTPHFSRLHPNLDLRAGRFEVHRNSLPWPATDHPRRAGVSAFGMGGVNCHIVLQEAGQAISSRGDGIGVQLERPRHVLALGAHSLSALRALVDSHCQALATIQQLQLADYCYSNNVGRRQWPLRIGVSAEDAVGLASALRAALADRGDKNREPTTPTVCFLFPGQGSHSPGAVDDLYKTYPIFRDAIDICDDKLAGVIDRSIRALLCDERFSADLENTRYQQPAIFALGYAFAQLWMSWGVQPMMVLGHSLGEYVAACVADRLTLDQALYLVNARAEAVARYAHPGRMAAVGMSGAELVEYLAVNEPDTALAASNTPQQSVVAGPPQAVERFVERFTRQGGFARMLPVTQAFHSEAVDPVLKPFGQALGKTTQSSGTIKMISTLRGSVLPDEPVDSAYWLSQLREPVNFTGALSAARAEGATMFIELGARAVLGPLVRQAFAGDSSIAVIDGEDENVGAALASAVARYFDLGGEVDWQGFDSPWVRRRRPVPLYPFQRERYFIERDAESGSIAPGDTPLAQANLATPCGSDSLVAHPLLGTRLSLPGSEDQRFEVVINPVKLGWLDQHRIFTAIVMPAVGYIEAMAAIAMQVLPSRGFSLSNFMVHRAMSWGNDETYRHVQTVLSAVPGGGREVRIFSRGASTDDPWSLHASALLDTFDGSAARVADLSLSAVNSEFEGAERTGQEILAEERVRGIDLGPAFEVIDIVRIAANRALSRIRIPLSIRADQDKYLIHPAVFEGAYLTLTAIYPEQSGPLSYVPLGVEAIQFVDGALATASSHRFAWCKAVLKPPPENRKPTDRDILRADLSFHDEHGRALALFSGVSVKVASPERMLLPGNVDDGNSRNVLGIAKRQSSLELYQPRMVATPRRHEPPDDPGGPWLLALDRRGFDWIRSAISGPPRRLELIVGDTDSDLLKNMRRRTNAAAVSGIIDGRGLSHALADCANPAEMAVRNGRLAPALYSLCNALTPSPILLHASFGSLARPGGGAPIAANGWLPGFVRALAIERPDLASMLVDFDLDCDARAIIETLEGEIADLDPLAPPCGDLIGWYGGVRYMERLSWFNPDVPPTMTGQAALADNGLRADRSYVISGGAGALGGMLATDLLARGAGQLVVLARPTVPRDIGAKDCPADARVNIVHVDLTEINQVSKELESWRRSVGALPIGGVFHLGGEIDDGAFDRLDAHRFAAVMAPKIQGAWSLHCATLGDPLDLFVMFGSSSAVTGAAGQTNYAAANSFLDTFARYRLAHGLPALTVDWPSWEGLGMSAVSGLAERLLLRGESPIEPSRALACLAEWCSSPHDSGHFAPLSFDWLRMGRSLHRHPGFLAELLQTQPVVSPAVVSDLWDLPRTALQNKIEDLIAQRLMEILGMKNPPDRDVGFFSLGLDSVSAIELRNWLNHRLSLNLEQTATFDFPTIDRLAEAIMASIEERVRPDFNTSSLASESFRDAAVTQDGVDRTDTNLVPTDYAMLLSQRLNLAKGHDNG